MDAAKDGRRSCRLPLRSAWGIKSAARPQWHREGHPPIYRERRTIGLHTGRCLSGFGEGCMVQACIDARNQESPISQSSGVEPIRKGLNTHTHAVYNAVGRCFTVLLAIHYPPLQHHLRNQLRTSPSRPRLSPYPSCPQAKASARPSSLRAKRSVAPRPDSRAHKPAIRCSRKRPMHSPNASAPSRTKSTKPSARWAP